MDEPFHSGSASSEVVSPRSGAKGRVYIKTFGCQMNEYDSEKLAKILEQSYSAVDSAEEADLVLVNTCSVRDKPEQKLYSMLGALKELKKERPHLLVGVGGCVAQQEGERILKRNAGVDFVFGTHNLSLVPSLIERRRRFGRPQVAVDYRDEWEDLPLGYTGGERVSVFVSISRGCNKRCSYCIVPTTRGPEVSRAAEEIEKEVRIAAHRGAREIVLLGQSVNSWGLDLSPRRRFVELFDRVSAVAGVERIRFTSPHPQEVRRDFIELVTSNPKVCRHIHMPLQSGSDAVLKRMHRNYRREKYLRIIAALKERVPDMGITTDLIVGFPGESEADFRQTIEVMEAVQFQNSFSFMFSPRPGTEAAQMKDHVTEEEKLRRLQVLQARQEEITAAQLKSWVGQEVEVLIDGPTSRNPRAFFGRSSQNIVVNLEEEGSAALRPGMTVAARVEAAARFSLKARCVSVIKG